MTVLELLKDITPLLNDRGGRPFPILTAINNVLRAIVRDLRSRKSDLVIADLSLDFTVAGNGLAQLPADFDGLKGKPWTGNNRPIDRIASGNTERAYFQGKTGTQPKRYSLEGTNLRLFPAPSVDLTVLGRYYQKHVDVTAMNEEVPFSGDFQDTIINGIMLLNQHGPLYSITTEFKTFIEEEVGRTMYRRDDHVRRVTSQFL